MNTDSPRCPHCLLPDQGVSHFTSAKKAGDLGETLCKRGGGRIARGDYWGWACPSDHTCHLTRMPPLPDPDVS